MIKQSPKSNQETYHHFENKKRDDLSALERILTLHSDWEAKLVQKKTEPRMRLVLTSKLPIGSLKLIEKQIFHPCLFLFLADL